MDTTALQENMEEVKHSSSKSEFDELCRIFLTENSMKLGHWLRGFLHSILYFCPTHK